MSSRGERLSSADVAWLHMDRPTNLMVINSVLLFDERLDWRRFEEVIQRRLVERYPRFRQRVRDGRLEPGGPRWEDVRDFDLARHLHRRGLSEPGDEAALQALAGDLAALPLDRSKPLWDMYLVDGLDDRSAVIVRMHHCIADGIALAQVMLSLTDEAPGSDSDADVPAPRSRARTVLPGAVAAPVTVAGESLSAVVGPLADAASAVGRLARASVREGLTTVVRPCHALELADGFAADARALAKLVFTPGDGPNVFKGDHGAGRNVAWSRSLPLTRFKALARAHDATVNDVALAAVSGALRGYVLSRGEEPHQMRTLVPVNLRPPDPGVPIELGNRFGLVFLELPVDRSSRRERLGELKRRMDAIKASPEGPVSYLVLEAVGLTVPEVESRVIDIFTAKATAVTTNVSGPSAAVHLAGARLGTVLVWAPTAGSVGMSVSIFSYAGAISIGLLGHTRLVPDPQAIVQRIQGELAAMSRLAPRRATRAA